MAGSKANQFDFSGKKLATSLDGSGRYYISFNEYHIEELKRFAARDPEEALISDDLYNVATPKDIVTLIGGRSLKDFSVKERAFVHPDRRSIPGLPGLPGAILIAERYVHRFTLPEIIYYETLPLSVAIDSTPYPEVVDILVSAGCDPTKGLNGWRPGRDEIEPEVMAALLKYSPSVEPGFTTRWAGAPDLFEPDSFRLLLRYAGTVNERDKHGKTPLLAATWYTTGASHGKELKLPYVRVLVEEGADVNARDEEGNTPLYNAIATSNFETARFLIASGAHHGGQAPGDTYSLLKTAISEGVWVIADAETDSDAEKRTVQKKKIPSILEVIRLLAKNIRSDSAEATEAYAIAASYYHGEAIVSVLKKVWRNEFLALK